MLLTGLILVFKTLQYYFSKQSSVCVRGRANILLFYLILHVMCIKHCTHIPYFKCGNVHYNPPFRRTKRHRSVKRSRASKMQLRKIFLYYSTTLGTTKLLSLLTAFIRTFSTGSEGSATSLRRSLRYTL